MDGTIFNYCDLSPELVEDVASNLLSGKTTAVLGPPYVGKSLLAKKVGLSVAEQGGGRLLEIPLNRLKHITNTDDLFRYFKPLFGPSAKDSRELAELLADAQDLPILWLSNLDSLPQPAARSILTAIRDRSPGEIIWYRDYGGIEPARVDPRTELRSGLFDADRGPRVRPRLSQRASRGLRQDFGRN